MATQQPFMLLHPTSSYPRNLNSPQSHSGSSFNTAQAINSISSSASHFIAAANVSSYGYGNFNSAVASGSTMAPQMSSFKAPAHKHAHHLHSIPPREKSTRTLIIDHMLWVHGRTRFAQARAELGMTDRTGGPSFPSYTYRTRPENYEEEEEVGSEGEEPIMLKARAGGPGHPHNDEEDERLGRQDLNLARSLRLRAEGLEKVVTSMLDQPPPILHPLNDDDGFSPPTSPNLNPVKTGEHPHTLPNGVRLRLALGTIINDLFARQAPHPPYRHTHPPTPTPQMTSPPEHPPTPAHPSDLPEVLLPLMSITGARSAVQNKSGHQRSQSLSQSQNQRETQSLPIDSMPPPYLSYTPPRNSGISGNTYQSSNASSSSPTSRNFQTGPSPFSIPNSQRHQHTQTAHNQSSNNSRIHTPTQLFATKPLQTIPSQRTRTFYGSGADPATANSPPAFRCPRHLHNGCDICVEAQSPPRQSSSSGTGRVVGSAVSFGTASMGVTSPGISNSVLNGNNHGNGNTWKVVSSGLGGGGITGLQDGSGIGTGLLKPRVRGNALRRKVGGLEEVGEEGTTGAGNTKLSKLIPRFIRLSALVAGELGREARGEEDDVGVSDRGGKELSQSQGRSLGDPLASWDAERAATPVAASPASPLLGSASPKTDKARAHKKMYDYALRPTIEWYLLLAGLLTRAVLEGYLTAGWRGTDAVEYLLLVGLGLGVSDIREGGDGDDRKKEAEREGDEFSEFDPDELPSLAEAVKVLFPGLRNLTVGSGMKGKGKAEEEYEYEMFERLRKFYDIPASTPDLSTHMEDLAWQYPAEPVERAAVRFCEAIAKWRGKPELETYKKHPPKIMAGSVDDPNAFPGAMTIESLVHSNPTTPTMGNAVTGRGARRKVLKKPSIDVYFAAPVLREAGGGIRMGWARSSGKRARESDEGVDGGSKRVHT